MNSALRVVLDTNVLINSLSLRSPFRALIDRLLDSKFDLFVTTQILLEYEEKNPRTV